MRKKSIVVLGPSLTAVSGVSTHLNMLYASQLTREFELIHFQVGSEGRRESDLGKALRALVSPWQLFLLIITRRPSIVHINSVRDSKALCRDFVYLIVAKGLGRKVVSQFHGGELPQTPFLRSRLHTWLLRCFMGWTDAVVVLSQEELRSHKAFSPAATIVCIPHAIISDELLGPISLPDAQRPLRLVFVGRLIREKGLFEVLEALPSLLASGRQIELHIAGAGREEPALKALASRLSLGSAVRFIGPVFGASKNRLWLLADVFVFPTYHKEGLPYALLEAMAAGTPPVTCAVAAIPDVITDGVHGLIVPSKNVQALATMIARLYDDRVLLYRMALAGRERVLEHYTLTPLSADFSRLYAIVST